MGASVACLIHCLLLPLVLAILPAASGWLGLPEEFHVLAFALAVPASSFAMIQGYRHHGAILPVMLGATGLTLVGIGALSGFRLAAETGFTVSGSVLLAIGHLRNWRLRRLAWRTSLRCPDDAGCRCT